MQTTGALKGVRERVREYGPRWFLIVDDNPDDELLARRAYASTGRPEKLVAAQNGEEALELMRSRSSPALVLLDLKLPRISGADVLMAMKDDPQLSTVPVIIFTSSNSMSDVAACYELGCNAFVQKPVEFDEFMSVTKRTLEFWLSVNTTFNELAT